MTGPAHPIQTARSLLIAASTLVALTLAGCASVQNTSQQDYVYEMARGCSIPNVWLKRVEPDGRYWVLAEPRQEYQFRDCMNAQVKAHPFLDWLTVQKREAKLGTAGGSATTVASVPSGPVMVPIWKVGDEWEYAFKSPSGSGFERLDGVVVLRETPPRLHYSWPLIVGKTWEQDYKQERPVQRQTVNRSGTWTVETEEGVTVPGGTFKTLRIVSRNKNNGALANELWYAPEVKQWVKIREMLESGVRERELVAYKLAK